MMLYPNIDNNQLIQTFELIDDQDEFQFQIQNFDFIEQPLLLRLNVWLEFFNVHCFCIPGLYNNTIYSLFDAIKTNEMFRTQTSHEFNLSLKFYEQLFNSVLTISVNNKESAKHLLNISLIYGKYPGMLVRSLKIGIRILQSGTSEFHLNSLFEFLFVKYEDPYFLTKNLNNLEINEIDVMMMVLQGNNIRYYDKLPFSLSRKEAFILINQIPKNLKFKNKVLPRSIVCAKLLISNTSRKELLYPFLYHNKIFKHNITVFHRDISFWRRAYNLLCKVNWKRTNLSIQEYIDYFEYKKYTEDPKYNLNHRTINSITRAIHRWHEAAEFAKDKGILNLRWGGLEKQNLKIVHNKIMYVIKQITSGYELYEESEEMKHCAFTYINGCANGYTSIWSIKRKVNAKLEHYLTLEVRKNKIIQIKGKRNRRANQTDYDVIKLWAHEVGLVIDTYY